MHNPRPCTTVFLIMLTAALSCTCHLYSQTASRGDSTSLFTRLTREDIRKLPVTGLLELLTSQASVIDLTGTPFEKNGYAMRGIQDLRMRGGRPGEIALVIDGIRTDAQLLGTIDRWVDINDIEEITFRPGWHDVRYGNTLSGVIEIATREPSEEFTGYADYRSSNPLRSGALDTGNGAELDYHSLQWGLSGPFPYYDRIRLKASGAFRMQTDAVYELDGVIWDAHRDTDGDGILDLPSSLEILNAYAYNENHLITSIEARETATNAKVGGQTGRYVNPLDNRSGWLGLGWDNTFDAGIDLTYDITDRMKLRAGFRHNQTYEQAETRNPRYLYNWPVGDYMYIRPTRLNGRSQPLQFNDSDDPVLQYYSYNVTGMGSRPVNFRSADRYSFAFTHRLNPSTSYSVRGQVFRQTRKTRMLTGYANRFKSGRWHFSPDWDYITDKEDYNFYGIYQYNDPWEGYYRIQDCTAYYEGDQSFTYDGRIDLTSRLNDNHNLRTGVEFRYIDLRREDYQSGSELDNNPTIYQMFPKEGAWYISDRMEYASIVVNLGLRMDYANAGGSMWADVLDPLAPQTPDPGIEYNGWVEDKDKFKFSPRIAIMLPLSSSASFFSNVGIYRQHANYRDMYRAPGKYREWSLFYGGNPIIGNPSLDMEKAIKYEFGLTKRLPGGLQAQAAYWMKKTTNQAGTVRVSDNTNSPSDFAVKYSVFLNNNYGSAHGLDLLLN